MPTNSPSPNIERAEYIEVPFVPSAATRLRESMAAGEFGEPIPNYFARAIALGLVGAAIGALIYALFVGITGISLGYLAILVGFLVGKAMTIGSGDRGGQQYQITAVAMTYLSVAAAHSMLLWWLLHRTGHTNLNGSIVLALAKYGLTFPALQLTRSPGSGLIGLIILFVGMRAAWRMTSGDPGAARHPFKR